MSRIAYVNGRYRPLSEPAMPAEDRGLQFADAVYEVVLVHRGGLVDSAYHMERLERSLAEIGIPLPMSRLALGLVMGEVIRRNRIVDGIVYLQVSRGTAPRNAAPFPVGIVPNIIMTARRVAPPDPAASVNGIGVKTVPDIRWRRRDIKTTALLANALAKQQAIDAGCQDAWQVDADGYVTEASAANAWIVTKDKQIVTRGRSHDILWGVTRRRLLELAKELGFSLVERPFTVAEAKAAAEAFQTSASSYVLPVTRIDDTSIGNGRAGSVTTALAECYRAHVEGQAS